jgi:hypothetical protein
MKVAKLKAIEALKKITNKYQTSFIPKNY